MSVGEQPRFAAMVKRRRNLDDYASHSRLRAFACRFERSPLTTMAISAKALSVCKLKEENESADERP